VTCDVAIFAGIYIFRVTCVQYSDAPKSTTSSTQWVILRNQKTNITTEGEERKKRISKIVQLLCSASDTDDEKIKKIESEGEGDERDNR
jgi:hypothetical protein